MLCMVKTVDRFKTFVGSTPVEIQKKINNWLREKQSEGRDVKIISTSLSIETWDEDEDSDSGIFIMALVSFSISPPKPNPPIIDMTDEREERGPQIIHRKKPVREKWEEGGATGQGQNINFLP